MYQFTSLRFMNIIGLSLIFLSNSLWAYSVQDAVYQTLQNHPDILRSKAEASAAEQDVHVAQGGLYPSLDITAGLGREDSNNPATRGTGRGSRQFTRHESEAFLQQMIYDGGLVPGTVKQRRFDYEASRHKIAERQEDLAYQAVAAYHDVLRNREVVSIQQFNVKAHRDLVYKVKRSLDAGASRKSELSLANARLALSISRLEAAQGVLENANDTFMKITGYAPPESLQKPGLPKNLPQTEAQAHALGLSISPSVKATSAEAEALNASIGVAKAAFYPRFTLDVSKSYNNNLDGVPGLNDETLAALRVRYNLIKGGSDLANVRATRERERAAVDALANIKRSIQEDISLSWNDLVASKAQIPYQKQHRDESLAVFNAYVKQFQLGQRTLFDLLNAQAEYYEASINYITQQYDMSKGSYRLLASMGNLVNTLSQGNQAIEKAADRSVVEKIPLNKKVASKQSITTLDNENLSNNSNSDKEYTLQVYAASTEVSAKQFIHTHQVPNARVVGATSNGQTVYRVLSGEYASELQAEEAIQNLPVHLQTQNPLIRPIERVS